MYVTFDRAKVTKARSGAGEEGYSPAPDTSTPFAVSLKNPHIQSRVGASVWIRTPATLRSADALRAAHITPHAPAILHRERTAVGEGALSPALQFVVRLAPAARAYAMLVDLREHNNLSSLS